MSTDRVSPLTPDAEKYFKISENICRVRLLALHFMTIRILYLFSTLYTGASNGPYTTNGRSEYFPFISSESFFARSAEELTSSFSSEDVSVSKAISQNGGKTRSFRSRISL